MAELLASELSEACACSLVPLNLPMSSVQGFRTQVAKKVTQASGDVTKNEDSSFCRPLLVAVLLYHAESVSLASSNLWNFCSF